MPYAGEEGRPENKAGQAKPCLGFPFSLRVLLAQLFPLLPTQAVLSVKLQAGICIQATPIPTSPCTRNPN